MSVTIVVTGAGSGGHITPLLAVTAELKRTHPDCRIIYIGQTGDTLGDIPASDPNIDESYTVRAGKLRRYHGEGWRQLLDIKTMMFNLRDALYVLIGLYQSWRLLRALRPNVIFIKGGFVGVPIGLAAAVLKTPYITHDSDAVPGLANRLIARWASKHAVALPTEIYPYPLAKTISTGIPLQKDFVPVTEKVFRQYRKDIKIPVSAKMLFVSGGGLGSQRINDAICEIVPHLLSDLPDLYIVQAVGRAHIESLEIRYKQMLGPTLLKRMQLYGYLTDSYRYSGAADVIVARAGATSLAEFAMQGRACLIIPAPFLTGGQQLKNGAILAEKQAAIVLPESDVVTDPNRLAKQLRQVLQDRMQQKNLATNIHALARPKAATHIAELLYESIDNA